MRNVCLWAVRLTSSHDGTAVGQNTLSYCQIRQTLISETPERRNVRNESQDVLPSANV